MQEEVVWNELRSGEMGGKNPYLYNLEPNREEWK